MKKNILSIRNSVYALFVIILIIIAGCGGGEDNGMTSSYTPPPVVPANPGSVTSTPPVSTVGTTVENTIVPSGKSSTSNYQPEELENYLKNGYGQWDYRSGNIYDRRLDLIPSGYAERTTDSSRNLLRFFAITDVHIADIQSPAQLIKFGLQIGSDGVSYYSPSMTYSMQFFDATIKTVNNLHKTKAFDFGIFLGDALNIGQYNELQWYLDIIDGMNINPNSDPLSTTDTDYIQPFKAAGLDPSINWYQTIGNHDHFWNGTYNSTDRLNNIATGSYIDNLGNTLFDLLTNVYYYLGRININSDYGNVEPLYGTTRINTNPERRLVQRREWINNFFGTMSMPNGHGFYAPERVADPTLAGCYSFEPKSNLPLKVIVLDDTEDEPLSGFVAYNGYIDNERFEWLKSELQEGQDNDKLMIIAAHIPIGVDPSTWDNYVYPRESTILTELKKYPNLIMWTSGHRHLNTITPQPSIDYSHPENGFWVVETASLKDFPQQFRLFDIVLNDDNTISIFATNVDPKLEPGTVAEKSRTMSVAFYQLFNGKSYLNYNPSGSYNAELLKKLTPEMQIILSKLK